MIFDGIDNIDTALVQMSYILTSDEKKELTNLKQSEKEKFFLLVWVFYCKVGLILPLFGGDLSYPRLFHLLHPFPASYAALCFKRFS